MQILVVEDEPKVGHALKEGLRAEGYEVALATTGEEGFFLANSRAFDLIVLDVMLPAHDGLEVLAALRAQRKQRPFCCSPPETQWKTASLGSTRGLTITWSSHLLSRS